MEPIRSLVRRSGGLVATHELYEAGHDRHSVAALVRRGGLIRVRQGWFCAPGTARELVRAARVGGRATCRTALRLADTWTVPDSRLHVVVPAHAVRLRTARSPTMRRSEHGDAGTVIHWRDTPVSSRLIVDPLAALVDASSCGGPDELAAAADSLLRSGRATRSQLALVAASLPSAAREAVLGADGVCESGIETVLWRRFRRGGVPARRQVVVVGVGRVDFVIGRRLVVEADGETYHVDPLQFENDRRRDAALSSAGFRVLRFSYDQILHRRAEVDAAISAAIRRGDADG